MMIVNTALEAFYRLVSEGQKVVGVDLDQDVEAFVVYALLRNMNNVALKEMVFAELLLKGMSQKNTDQLETVLDGALIYAGCYPKRAQKLGVSPSYFSDIGKMASLELAHYYHVIKSSSQKTYAKISMEFDRLIMVLQSFFATQEVSKIYQASFFEWQIKNN